MILRLPHCCLFLTVTFIKHLAKIWKLQKLNKVKSFHQFHIQAQDHIHNQTNKKIVYVSTKNIPFCASCSRKEKCHRSINKN